MGCGASVPGAAIPPESTAAQAAQSDVSGNRPAAPTPGTQGARDAAAGLQTPGPQTIKDAAGEAHQPDGAKRRHVSECAVTLAFLLHFWEKEVVGRYGAEAARAVTTERVKNDIILAATAGSRVRYMDVPGLVDPAVVGRPDFFVSHAWRMPFSLLVEGVKNYLKGAVPEDVHVWVDLFAVDQYSSMDADLGGLEDCIGACSAGTLVVLDGEVSPIYRSWCLYEFLATVRHKSISQLVFLRPEGMGRRELAGVFQRVDVGRAQCYDKAKEAEILGTILAQFGSADAFNAHLRLMLLLEPLDYWPDVQRLLEQAEQSGSEFNFQPLAAALEAQRGPAAAASAATPGAGSQDGEQPGVQKLKAPALACILGGSGSGKSVLSAMLCKRLLLASKEIGQEATAHMLAVTASEPASAVPVHACHFFKHNDRRREEPGRVLKSLAYQLALSHQEHLMAYYTGLQVDLLEDAGDDVDKLFELLLRKPLAEHLPAGTPVTLLLDALDEAGMKLEQPDAPASNLGYLLLRLCDTLPHSVSILLTARPAETAPMLGALRRRFPALAVLNPEDLRDAHGLQHRVVWHLSELLGVAQEHADAWLQQTLRAQRALQQQQQQQQGLGGAAASATTDASAAVGGAAGGSSSNMVYLATLVQLLSGVAASTVGSLQDMPTSLDQAYALLMGSRLGALPQQTQQEVGQLLSVLLAAQEPLALSLLSDMGLLPALAHLPPGLFFAHGYVVFLLHKSLSEWLLGTGCGLEVSVPGGHSALAQHLMSKQVGLGPKADAYALKYLATHLVRMPPKRSADACAWLETLLLRSWGYLQGVFQQGFWPGLTRQLGQLPHATTALPQPVSDGGRWLQQACHVIVQDPCKQLVVTAVQCPTGTAVFQAGQQEAGKRWGQAPLLGVTPPGRKTWSPLLATLQELEWPVYTAAFTPDGSQLVTVGMDKLVRVWDPHTFECVALLAGHTAGVRGVAVSPDGSRIASASEDASIRLWDVVTLECVGVLAGHPGQLHSVAFSPDGAYLAAGCMQDGTVHLWEVRTMQRSAVLQGHGTGVRCVAFSPDGSRPCLVTGGDDNTARVWELASGTCNTFPSVLEGHGGAVRGVAFSPDGAKLATACADKAVRVWDAASLACVATLTGHTDGVWCVAFSPDSRWLASSGDDRVARVWEVGSSSSSSSRCVGQLEGHNGTVMGLAFSPDSALLCSACTDRRARLWDVRLLASDGSAAGDSATAAATAAAAISQVAGSGATGNSTSSMPHGVSMAGHTSHVNGVAYSPDGLRFVTASEDCTAIVWEAASLTPVGVLQGHADWVNRVVYSPDGSTLATSSSDMSVKLWDAGTYACMATMTGHTEAVFGLAYSPDGSLLASSSMDAHIRLWDTATHACKHTLQAHAGSVLGVAFSPCGTKLATGGIDFQVRLWDPSTGECIKTIMAHFMCAIQSVTYCPDGAHVISTSMDCTAKVWAVETQECTAVLSGHTDHVTGSAVSTDGRYLATASMDGSVRVWDMASYECVATLHGHTDGVQKVAWSPDGSTLVSVCRDKTARLWDMTGLKAPPATV